MEFVVHNIIRTNSESSFTFHIYCKRETGGFFKASLNSPKLTKLETGWLSKHVYFKVKFVWVEFIAKMLKVK